MKQYLIAIALLLSGCATVPERFTHEEITIPRYDPAHLVVIAEVCTTLPTQDNILKGNTVSREDVFSSGQYTAILIGTTIDNQSIYRGNIAEPQNLTYFTVNTPTEGKYLFKRNYRKYKLNEWSQWETPDSLIDDKHNFNVRDDHPFFWLATRDKDRTNELKKLPYKIEDSPKVRFKIMHDDQYSRENFNEYNREKIVIEHSLPKCE